MKESLAPIGIDFDIENPTASFEAGKNMLINKAREFGFDIKDGSSGSEIKEVMFGKLKDMGIDLGNPSSLMQFAMEHMDMIQPIISQFMGGMMQPEQQQQQMMPMPQQMPMAMPMQMQMPQQAQPMQQSMYFFIFHHYHHHQHHHLVIVTYLRAQITPKI